MKDNPSLPKGTAQKVAETLFVALQYLLPHHLLSRLMHSVTRIEMKGFKDTLIRRVIDWYKVDMSEALESDPRAYRSFNDFFTRALRPDARPVAEAANAIACPADGTLSAAGDIEDGYLFQAKDHDYALLELLGGDTALSRLFEEGSFATVYLSPRDYHRVHMPYGGKLKKMVHVPGRLFSVNDTTCQKVPRLFARNERVIALFDTDIGPMAVILVGAIFVASIDTVWAGTVTPVHQRISSWNYPPTSRAKAITLNKGEEMGRFNMGSTVILLFGKDAVEWMENLSPGKQLKMGEMVGETSP
jgi:phosphatidylserine decarboxylase